MRPYRELFDRVRKRTGMYLAKESYAEAAAFVLGYDLAQDGRVMRGFREWLVMRLGTGSNLTWSALVLHAAFPGAASPQDEPSRSPEGERRAIDSLFEL